jgi:hypothetical protein
MEMLLVFLYWFLYFATLLNVFMRSRRFSVFRYKIISSTNMDNLTSSFPIWISYISFFYLIALVRNSKDEEREHSCLVPDFRGNGFSFSLFSTMLAIGWSYTAFIMFRTVTPISTFFRAFIYFFQSFFLWNCVAFYQRLLLHILRWLRVFLSLILFCVLYYIYWFVYVLPSFHPWMKPT